MPTAPMELRRCVSRASRLPDYRSPWARHAAQPQARWVQLTLYTLKRHLKYPLVLCHKVVPTDVPGVMRGKKRTPGTPTREITTYWRGPIVERVLPAVVQQHVGHAIASAIDNNAAETARMVADHASAAVKETLGKQAGIGTLAAPVPSPPPPSAAPVVTTVEAAPVDTTVDTTLEASTVGRALGGRAADAVNRVRRQRDGSGSGR